MQLLLWEPQRIHVALVQLHNLKSGQAVCVQCVLPYRHISKMYFCISNPASLGLYLGWHLLWRIFLVSCVLIGGPHLKFFFLLLPHLIQTRTNTLAVDEEEAVPQGVYTKEGYPDPERVVKAVVHLPICQTWVLPDTETHIDHWRGSEMHRESRTSRDCLLDIEWWVNSELC